MTMTRYSSKLYNINMDINYIYDNISNITGKIKIKDNEFHIIKINEFELMKQHDYKLSQLKQICNYYKIIKSGKKKDIVNNIYNILKYSFYVIKIQKVFRGKLLRTYIKLSGPAFKKRSLCINDTDFATLEPIIEIPFNQFFSFTDNNNIYGCNIISLHQLIYSKTNNNNNNIITLNTYTREMLDNNVLKIFYN